VIESGFWAAFGIAPPVPEYRFHPVRKWRIDYAWPDRKLAVEIEGGVHIRGRHVRPAGFTKDMEKYNALDEAGWRLLRYKPGKIDFLQIKRVLEK
jgi:very-short-patch-repair endonuclease